MPRVIQIVRRCGRFRGNREMRGLKSKVEVNEYSIPKPVFVIASIATLQIRKAVRHSYHMANILRAQPTSKAPLSSCQPIKQWCAWVRLFDGRQQPNTAPFEYYCQF